MTFEQSAELLGIDLPLQPQGRRAGSLPKARRGAAFGVVIVGFVIAGGLGRA